MHHHTSQIVGAPLWLVHVFHLGNTPILAPLTCKKATMASATPTSSNPVNNPFITKLPTSREPSPLTLSLDSSSDSKITISRKSYIMSSTASNVLIPVVEHYSLHHAPIMTVGVPTSAILLELKDACEDFFTNAKERISKKLRVICILPGFKDPIIHGWISSDHWYACCVYRHGCVQF